MKKNYDIVVRWRAFPLHPDTPEDGLLLDRLFADASMDVRGMMRHLKKTASDLGLPFGERRKTYNSRLAQELGLWAEAMNAGDAFHAAAFRAYFADGKNIAKMPILLDLAESLGLSREEAETVLRTGAFKPAVDQDWALSREKAITAVPTFLMNQERLVGAQPYEKLEGLMVAHGIKQRERSLSE